MSLNGISLAVGATAMAPTGGTATVFSQDDVEVNSGIHVSDPASDFYSRPAITYRSRPSTKQPDGSFSKAKRFWTVVQPKALANGEISFQVFRGELEVHPEMSNADCDALVYLGCQAITDSEAADFRHAGSIG